ncbi:MAG: tRNA preQ1(34) S-adenosylmethionine ribosyltransferase-isomerase QueA [Prochlorotrichaceae cyanobacterium]
MLPFQVVPAIGDDRLSAYDYELPSDRIAQNPVSPRDHSRLLVLQSPTDIAHHRFRDLPSLLKPGDLLVLNNTRVIPARLYGYKTGTNTGTTAGEASRGTPVEILLLEQQGNAPAETIQPQWLALVKPGKRLKPGAEIEFPDPNHPESVALRAKVLAIDEATGGRILQFYPAPDRSFWDCLEHLGQIPLPPYIRESQAADEQYQTVYSSQAGAVAAPTAGLHFTPELLQRLAEVGIEQTTLTLHVGVGTFRPVETERITEHQMHSEWVEIKAETVEKIQATQARGGRIIAVGTTVVRSLEGVIAQTGSLQPFQGKVNLFITPGFTWQVVSGLITNFHLPKSSLLMLVSALVGRKRLLNLYNEAIVQGYRFYSFGDAMLILPEARPTRDSPVP